MADELPPLIEAPEQDTPTHQALVAHQADWASRFGGSDTSLAQRYRHNQQIAQGIAQTQQAQAAHLEDTLAHDKGAQDLYFRQQQLDATAQNRTQQLAMRQAQFEAGQKQRDLQIKTTQAKLATAHDMLDQIGAAATDYTNAITSGQVKAGTPEHAALVAGLVGKYPAAADSPFMRGAFKAAKVQADPQDILDQFNTLKAQLTPDTQITTDTKGVPHLTAKSADAVANLAARTENVQARTAATTAGEALKEAAQGAKQDTAIAKDASGINKEIARIEKESPIWMGTTGIAPDKNGVERFGFPQPAAKDILSKVGISKSPLDNRKSFEEAPAATPEAKAAYEHYQHLLQQRSAIESGAAPVVKKWKLVDGNLVPDN